MVEAMVAEDTKQAIEEMPLSLKDLGRLFDHLDVQLEIEGCDHSSKITSSFLASMNLNREEILRWLAEQGGFCDCEILANGEESWESEITKNTQQINQVRCGPGGPPPDALKRAAYFRR